MSPTILRTNATPIYDFLSHINAQQPQDGSGETETILDCGAGGPVPPLALFRQHGFETWGIDISEAALTQAVAFCKAHDLDINLQPGDMRALPFEDARFDYVYEHYAMCHLTKADTALAMHILKDVATRFVFCDIESPALESDAAYAQELELDNAVETVLGDAIAGTLARLPDLDQSTFIHIDPYTIFEPNAAGQTFFDVFLTASRLGIKSMLWYGYFTGEEQQSLTTRIAEAITANASLDPAKVYGLDVWLDLIRPDHIVADPGIVGCGVLTANLSTASHAAIAALAEGLLEIYEDSVLFDRYPGRLRAQRLAL